MSEAKDTLKKLRREPIPTSKYNVFYNFQTRFEEQGPSVSRHWDLDEERMT